MGTDPIPHLDYTPEEIATWGHVLSELKHLFPRHACQQYLESFPTFDFREGQVCGAGKIKGRQSKTAGPAGQPCPTSETCECAAWWFAGGPKAGMRTQGRGRKALHRGAQVKRGPMHRQRSMCCMGRVHGLTAVIHVQAQVHAGGAGPGPSKSTSLRPSSLPALCQGAHLGLKSTRGTCKVHIQLRPQAYAARAHETSVAYDTTPVLVLVAVLLLLQVPQLEDLSQTLRARTGWQIRPVVSSSVAWHSDCVLEDKCAQRATGLPPSTPACMPHRHACQGGRACDKESVAGGV